jgi:hypothetical protein
MNVCTMMPSLAHDVREFARRPSTIAQGAPSMVEGRSPATAKAGRYCLSQRQITTTMCELISGEGHRSERRAVIREKSFGILEG